jgi:hypothetical protein
LGVDIRCPYKIELPGPDGMQRRPTFSHFSDARELLLLDCAASLARKKIKIQSKTNKKISDMQ